MDNYWERLCGRCKLSPAVIGTIDDEMLCEGCDAHRLEALESLENEEE